MGEIINLSENIKGSFEKRKEKYPNLSDFQYDENTDTLTYHEESFSPAGYALIHTASVFFQLVPQDIYAYLKNGLYYQSTNEISKIISMITTEIVITEEEEKQLKTFVRQYFIRLAIYSNNNILFVNGMQDNVDLKDFASNLLERQKVINGVRTGIYNSIAANIILQEYNAISNETRYNQPTETAQANENNNELDRGISRTRQKPGNNYSFPEQEEINQQYAQNKRISMIAGFTSTVLVITSAITFGMYLALRLL